MFDRIVEKWKRKEKRTYDFGTLCACWLGAMILKCHRRHSLFKLLFCKLLSIPRIFFTPAKLEKPELRDEWTAWREECAFFVSWWFLYATKSMIKGAPSSPFVSDRRLWWSPWQLFVSLDSLYYPPYRESSSFISWSSVFLLFRSFSFVRCVALNLLCASIYVCD